MGEHRLTYYGISVSLYRKKSSTFLAVDTLELLPDARGSKQGVCRNEQEIPTTA